MFREIPNLLTLGNLACGLLGINALMDYNPYMRSETFIFAFILMGIAGVLDFFDGFTARLLKVDGEMGKQLDSLADLVTFGVLPGLIWKKFMDMTGACPPTGFCINQYVWLLIPLAAAYRLAKFNISTDQKVNFKGIPTPISGLALASWVLLFDGLNYAETQAMPGWNMDKIMTHFYVMLYMPLLASYLMVSDLDMLSFKFNKADQLNPYRIVLLVGLLVLFVLNYRIALPVFYIIYIVISQIAFSLVNKNSNE